MSFTSEYFASLTNPMMVMSSESLSIDIFLPTAFRPIPNFFANASLTIATFIEPASSNAVKSRPERSGTPMTWK